MINRGEEKRRLSWLTSGIFGNRREMLHPLSRVQDDGRDYAWIVGEDKSKWRPG